MPILKYVPPTKKILDHRNPEGGYYEAECEICGTKFYPKRSTGKFCNPNCRLIAHRAAVVIRNAIKGPISATEYMKIDFGRGNAEKGVGKKVSVKEALAEQRLVDERAKKRDEERREKIRNAGMHNLNED
jgi:hypothetical protein